MFTDSDRPEAGIVLAEAQVGATGLAQLATTVALNRTLTPQSLEPGQIVATVRTAQDLGLMPDGLSPQLIQEVSGLVEALKNAPTESCVDLGIFGQACIQIGQLAEQVAEPLLGMVRWEISDGIETVMGPLRMAGLIVIANKYLLPQVYDRVNELIPNNLLALAAAEALVVSATALANSILPLFLRGGFGSFGQSFTVGLGVGAATLLPEFIASAVTQNEQAGKIAGIAGQVAAAGYLGWPAIETAINLVKLLV